MHLADAYPSAQLAPQLGTPERAESYKWLFWLSNTLQATLMVYVYPDRWIEAATTAAAQQVKRQAQRRIGDQLTLLNDQLRASRGPWLLGSVFSVLDPFAFMLCRWTRGFDETVALPARMCPALAPYLQRMLERPTVQRVLAEERLSEPWI